LLFCFTRRLVNERDGWDVIKTRDVFRSSKVNTNSEHANTLSGCCLIKRGFLGSVHKLNAAVPRL